MLSANAKLALLMPLADFGQTGFCTQVMLSACDPPQLMQLRDAMNAVMARSKPPAGGRQPCVPLSLNTMQVLLMNLCSVSRALNPERPITCEHDTLLTLRLLPYREVCSNIGDHSSFHHS